MSSAGWKDMGPSRIQILAPLISTPRNGMNGRMRKMRPATIADQSHRRRTR